MAEPPMDKTNPRLDPPLQPETHRTLWIGAGVEGLALVLAVFLRGTFFPYLLGMVSCVWILRGAFPAMFAIHIDEQIIAGTPYRKKRVHQGLGDCGNSITSSCVDRIVHSLNNRPGTTRFSKNNPGWS